MKLSDLAATSAPVFFRTYSRWLSLFGRRESWDEVVTRCAVGFSRIGNLKLEQLELVAGCQVNGTVMPSGRWLWVGGTDWIEKQANFYGAYNCNSTNVDSLESFANVMDLLMQGCGVGVCLESKYVDQLPPIVNKVHVNIIDFAPVEQFLRLEDTEIDFEDNNCITITVGDSRQGWTDALHQILCIAALNLGETGLSCDGKFMIKVDLSNIRPDGERIVGFGGVSKSAGLGEFFKAIAEILNDTVDCKLTPVQCALLICTIGKVVVAGNVRRSAIIQQFDANNIEAQQLKSGMWKQLGEDWVIDPKLDCMRMANLTRVFHKKPTLQQCIDSVTEQFESGEGAIQWAGEAVARSNADLLNDEVKKQNFLYSYNLDPLNAKYYLANMMGLIQDDETLEFPQSFELEDRMSRYKLNPCFAAGTMVLTRNGHQAIENLVGKTVEVWDGLDWVKIDNFRITGEDRPVFTVKLYNGQSITATDYHSFILESGDRKILSELLPGDKLLTHGVLVDSGEIAEGAYLKGFLVGDGTNAQGHAKLSLYAPKYMCEQRLLDGAYSLKIKAVSLRGGSDTPYNTSGWGFADESYGRKNMQGLAQVDLLKWSTDAKINIPAEVYNWGAAAKSEFIAGVMDADGCVMDNANGFGYQITSVNLQWLVDFQLLLKTIGVDSKINPPRKGGYKDFGDRGGVCNTQDTHKLTISQTPSIALAKKCTFSRLVSFADRVTKYTLKSKWNKIESIEFSHVADKVYCCTVPTNHQFSLTNGITIGQCGEILLNNNFCNLSEVHLNQINPLKLNDQKQAFQAAGLSVSVLLHHEFNKTVYQTSRELDPIVGVSFTGLFDFFVTAFGAEWLRWWSEDRNPKFTVSAEGRVKLEAVLKVLGAGQNVANLFEDGCDGTIYSQCEKLYLKMWQITAEQTVRVYCAENEIKCPNRFTTVQPAGTKSLLTGASPGWHPPIAQRYIRRITFAAHDPVALACIDYGYSVTPSQKDKDEYGNLLHDAFDLRCTEWLIEIPTEVPWANLAGACDYDLNKFSAHAQFDFYMTVQQWYTQHNTSATISFRQHEIVELATAIHEAIDIDAGYISIALLARFDANETFPRLPFEPISLQRYNELHKAVLNRRYAYGQPVDFGDLLLKYDSRDAMQDAGCAPCDSEKCEVALK